MMSVAVSHFLSFDSLLHLAAACLAALSSEEQRRNLTMARLTKALAIASRPSTMPSAMAKLHRTLPLGDGSAAEEKVDLCHGEASKEVDGAGVTVKHRDLGDDDVATEENEDVPNVGEDAAEEKEDLNIGAVAVAAMSACEHGDLLHPESAATQVPDFLTIGKLRIRMRVQ